MSKYPEQLKNLRSYLEVTNESLFEVLKKRESIVFEIQKIKTNSRQNIFDKSREIQLFKSDFSRLATLNLNELLIYSLIIENDANKYNNTYPKWSKKEHLNSSSHDSLIEMINPLLLALYDKKSYSSLNIKKEFQADI
jgi:chorismate mutase